MNRLLNVLWMLMVLVVAGCGDKAGDGNVVKDADPTAIQEYEAQQKAIEEAETAAMKAAAKK
ncbi:hypothetical protein [Novipirellula caenicola]|uniref:Secreted protein n=1 Tax=Novipirellula caenicola TaxID=1536901 RepID=A0ABP9VT95_9BACT